MASQRRRGYESTSGEDGADALSGAFHQVAQGLVRVQEALRLQDALGLREQLAESRYQETLMLQKMEEAIQNFREEFIPRLQMVEERMNRAEGHIFFCVVGSGSEKSGERGTLEQLEGRIRNLEVAVHRALSAIFTFVDSIVAKLEVCTPPEESRVQLPASSPSGLNSTLISTSTSPSTSNSASEGSVQCTSASTSPRPRAAAAEGATAPRREAAGARVEPVSGHRGAAAQDEQRSRQRMQLRIRRSTRKWRAHK